VGPRAFVSERTFRLLALLGKAFTWPIVGMAFLGVFGLPRRWAWRSGLLVAVFAAGAVVTKGEARVVFNGLSGVCVLAAGGVLWTGRWGGRAARLVAGRVSELRHGPTASGQAPPGEAEPEGGDVAEEESGRQHSLVEKGRDGAGHLPLRLHLQVDPRHEERAGADQSTPPA
jgi:hypothetical protein